MEFCLKNMKYLVFLIFVSLETISAAHRLKRGAYDLPGGASEVLIKPIRQTFICNEDGYYADQDNNCQIFHVCHTAAFPSGAKRMLQYSFFCGNLTIFNQYTLTCTYPKDSVPCSKAHEYFHLNKIFKEDPDKPSGGGGGDGDVAADVGSRPPLKPQLPKGSIPPAKKPKLKSKIPSTNIQENDIPGSTPGKGSRPPPSPDRFQIDPCKHKIIITVKDEKDKTLESKTKIGNCDDKTRAVDTDKILNKFDESA